MIDKLLGNDIPTLNIEKWKRLANIYIDDAQSRIRFKELLDVFAGIPQDRGLMFKDYMEVKKNETEYMTSADYAFLADALEYLALKSTGYSLAKWMDKNDKEGTN